MSRRVLTRADVEAAQKDGRLELGPRDVVTPAARELAERLGVEIRHAGQPAAAPTPRASRELAEHPDAHQGTERAVVTAVGRNRPGVLAEITTALGGLECDVRDISQRTTGEFFHMVLTCAIPAGRDFKQMKDTLQCLGGEDDYVVRVMHERVFRFMHRV